MNYHIFFAVIYFAFIAIRIHYHRKARQVRADVVHQESSLNMAVRALLGLGYIGALILYIFYPSLLGWATLSLPVWARWTGAGISGLSLALIWWVQLALGVQFDTTLHTQRNHKLISHGPYRWVRHPMYTSLFLMGVGWLLLTANWSVGAPLVVSISFLVAVRVRHEEKVLIDLFGDEYITYMQNTGRFLPRLRC
jgi:protein-S-isoprenylcysteine O-methyltransferase Ste14